MLSFELVADELWCRSCDVSLAPESCSVDASVVVGRSEGRVVRLVAIRSASPVLRGTWLVGTSASERRFMYDLVRRGLERATTRVPAEGSWGVDEVPRAAGAPAAHAPVAGGTAHRAARLVTVTW